MSYTGESLEKVLPVLRCLPSGLYVDWDSHGTKVSVQAASQAGVQAIRAAFASSVWKRTWGSNTKWWRYETMVDGILLLIYAVTEAPAQCTAIMEERTITEEVPVQYETRTVRKKVLVGWNCDAAAAD